jgi:signal transduction histidine kinase
LSLKKQHSYFALVHLRLALKLAAVLLTGNKALAQLPPRPTGSDTITVGQYYAYGEQFELTNPDSARYFYLKGLQLAKKLNWKKGIAIYAGYEIVLLNNEGRYKEALDLTQEALRTIEQGTGTKRDLAVAYINVANEWQYLGDLTAASTFYLKAAEIAQLIQDKNLQRICYNNLASLFHELKDTAKLIVYAQKGLTIADALGQDYARASSMINLAVGMLERGKTQKAFELYDSVDAIAERQNDAVLKADAIQGKAEVFFRIGNTAKATSLWQQLERYAQQTQLPAYAMLASAGLASAFKAQGRLQQAATSIEQAIKQADSLQALLEMKTFYQQAAELYAQMGSYNVAYQKMLKYQQLQDTLLNQSRQSDIRLAEAKFQSEEKEKLLRLQQQRLQSQRTQLWLLAILVVLLLCLGGLLHRIYRQKRTLQLQKIEELEKEKQLLASQALLRGQEAERSRLAKDLHDGLGGMLSGIKLTLGTMKGNMIVSGDNAMLLTGALNRLDETIAEMRRVAHSMMPEALINLGLGQALLDYCERLREASDIEISYQQIGLDERLSGEMEITIYRMVQELLNNVVKHARAKEVLVQLSRHEGNLYITVEDDGIGFDVQAKSATGSAGITNVQSRTNYLKGSLDIQSEPGKGTSVLIEIPVLPV